MLAERSLWELLDELDEIVIRCDADGRLSEVNGAWRRIAGQDEGVLLNNLLADSHQREIWTQACETLRQGQIARGVRLALRTGKTSPLILEGSFKPHFDHQVFAGATGVLRDVSARAALEHQLELRTKALDASTAGITIADVNQPDMPLIYINRAFQNMTGYSVEETLGKNCRFLQADDRDQPSLNTLRAALKAGKSCVVTLRNYRKDGTLFWNELIMSPVVDAAGKLTHYLGIQNDITARVQAEERVQMYVNLVNHMSAGMFVYQVEDPADDSRIRLIAANPAAAAQLGVKTLNPMLGKLIDEAFPMLRERGLPALYLSVAQHKRLYTFEYAGPLDDGSPAVMNVQVFPLPGDCVGVIFEDITHRKQIEEQLRQQNEALVASNTAIERARAAAEDSTRLKSQFLATMSHELRTPLNAIIGYTEIQLAGMTGDLNQEQTDYQQRVLANATHLLRLINDVLDLSKIEAGRVEIQRRPFHLHNWIADIVRQNEALAQAKQLSLTVQIDPRLPQQIIGDAARLAQIAVNLLSNAIKFTEQGGVRIDLQLRAGGTWALVVADTGVGIPSHALEYIFDEFRQVDGSFQRQHSGTGLGLAIVRKLSLLMGGNVRVQSEVGKGSTFTVILPLLDSDAG